MNKNIIKFKTSVEVLRKFDTWIRRFDFNNFFFIQKHLTNKIKLFYLKSPYKKN